MIIFYKPGVTFFSIFLIFLTTLSHANSNAGLNLEWLDRSISPSKNFFTYANGNWQKQNPIPAGYGAWGIFYILRESVQVRIHQLLLSIIKQKNAPGSIEQKLGDFYLSGMDIDAINRLGLAPLQSEFDRIKAINNANSLQLAIAHLHKIGTDAVFNFSSMQDFKHSDKVIGVITQSGLGLPDRDYYLSNKSKFSEIRKIYLQHLSKTFKLLGDSLTAAERESQIVMDIETKIAKASLSQVELRNPYATYHIMDLKQLNNITPHFSWINYFQAVNYPQIKSINMATPNFFKDIDLQLQLIPLEHWKMYLRWRLIDTFAPYLSQAFIDEDFHMSSALSGMQKLLPRWKRVTATENSLLGFAVGKLYVKKYFSPAAKEQVVTMVNNIKHALRNDLHNLQWMTAATRKAAEAKLNLMQERVGYPEKWWDYSSLTINRGPYVLNVLRAQVFLVKRDLDKIGKPVDRTEWQMTPQTVNAYYDPSMNSINLPAGILEPPFFDLNAPMAINYGSIGFVIGHEMTHGFDDQGALFDGAGNLHNWWQATDLKQFNSKIQCIINQFSQYKVNGDIALKGKLVVGEATADLGGLILAYHALHASKYFNTATTIDGFTPDQQFFLGAAHIWTNNIRSKQALLLATTDPHPPAMYRVNGTLANMSQFAQAFAVPEGSPMINKHYCVIW